MRHLSLKTAAIAAALTASSILLAPVGAQAAPALAGAKLTAPGPAVDSVHWRRCWHRHHHHHVWRHHAYTYGYAAPSYVYPDTYGYAASPMTYDYGTYGSAANCGCGTYGSGLLGSPGLLGIGFLGL